MNNTIIHYENDFTVLYNIDDATTPYWVQTTTGDNPLYFAFGYPYSTYDRDNITPNKTNSHN